MALVFHPECKQRLVETCQNQPGIKLARLTIACVDDEASAGVGAPAWQRHGPKMIWPCILNASKKWMRVARMNLENKHARLTMVPVDDEVSPEDEAAADPAWHRHEPKVIWPRILNARKKWDK